MSAIRPLLGPLTGTAVAGVILYSMTGTLSTRTHQLSESLHMSSRSLRRLAQVDDTEDLLSKAHVAPDTATLASNYENFKESGKDQLRAAYTQPSRPSLREEIKARWNDHLISVTQFLSETDLDHAITATRTTFSDLYSKLTGQPTSSEPSALTQWAGRAFHKVQSATAVDSSTAPATLRDPLPPRHDIRLDAPNTYYVGQGASLR